MITIRNDPKLLKRKPFPTAANYLNELLTPVRALFNTREARGALARKRIEQQVERFPNGQYIEINLFERGVTLPLGWSLSDDAIREMRCQLFADRSECPTYGEDSLIALIPTPFYIYKIGAMLDGHSGKAGGLPVQTVDGKR